MTRRLLLCLLGLMLAAALVLAGVPAADGSPAPRAHTAATCADYPNQAAAQRAADTRDPDGNGVFCEELPCPCAGPGQTGGGGRGGAGGGGTNPPGCRRPVGVQRLVFSAAKYPHIRAHFRAAVRKGWPRILVVNRPGADARRDRLLEEIPTRAGFDRDEYPPALGRGRGRGLTRGSNPKGWRADVRFVGSSENQSHGASLGAKLRRFCNGTRFRYVFSDVSSSARRALVSAARYRGFIDVLNNRPTRAASQGAGWRAVFRERVPGRVRYRVCLRNLDNDVRKCWRARTGPRGRSKVFVALFVNDRGGPGRWRARWKVGGEVVASWRFRVRPEFG